MSIRKLIKFLLAIFFCWSMLAIAGIFWGAENILKEDAEDNLGEEVFYRWLTWLTFAKVNI